MDHDQTLTIYTVFAFGAGSKLLQYAAINGGFKDLDGDGKPFPDSSDTCGTPHPDPYCKEWDEDGDGVPDNYFAAYSGYELEESLTKAITDILKRTSSGTAVSVLSEKAEHGASLLQAVFFPEETIEEEGNVYTLNWIGHLYNWWIYRGLALTKINIREDTITDKKLRLCEDYVLRFVFDNSTNQLLLKAYEDADGDGLPDDNSTPTVTYNSLDEAHPVWEAGQKLKDKCPELRNIYTNIGGLTPFTETNWDLINDYLGSEYTDGTDDQADTQKLIAYIRGEDVYGFRSRSIGSSVWKLGDIIYSTPRIVTYSDYSVVYVGANDGMLHAFRLGYLDTTITNAVARLQNSKGDTGYDKLGEELWAFIPQNALPYLRYYADTEYPHLYYIDLSPFVIDADYDGDDTTEKVLIGGMRLGGAVGCNGTECITPPEDTCSDANSTSCIGLSSYFALDISDPENPQLLWEFKDPDLGFSYSGPAIVRKGSKYYVVFLSGPTDYEGDVAQPLKVFVLNLKTGQKVAELDQVEVNGSLTTLTNAFGGRLFTYTEGGPIYFGYVQEGTWHGGVLKLDTSGSDPANWSVSMVVADIGPVTVSVKEETFGTDEWLFFGGGRYFVKDDDADAVRYLYGVKPSLCEGKGHCTRDDLGDLTEVTGSPTAYGWYIKLDEQSGDWGAERLITDPTVYKRNATSGEVYFVTMQPNTHPCEFGGRSYIWRVEATTGGEVAEGMPGVLMVQLSTGQILEARDADIFTQAGGRKSGPYTGVPGEQSATIVGTVGTAWRGTILQWIER